eukprot:scaffold3051_cov167-Ochromonas_danica.AAC.6
MVGSHPRYNPPSPLSATTRRAMERMLCALPLDCKVRTNSRGEIAETATTRARNPAAAVQ